MAPITMSICRMTVACLFLGFYTITSATPVLASRDHVGDINVTASSHAVTIQNSTAVYLNDTSSDVDGWRKPPFNVKLPKSGGSVRFTSVGSKESALYVTLTLESLIRVIRAKLLSSWESQRADGDAIIAYTPIHLNHEGLVFRTDLKPGGRIWSKKTISAETIEDVLATVYAVMADGYELLRTFEAEIVGSSLVQGTIQLTDSLGAADWSAEASKFVSVNGVHGLALEKEGSVEPIMGVPMSATAALHQKIKKEFSSKDPHAAFSQGTWSTPTSRGALRLSLFQVTTEPTPFAFSNDEAEQILYDSLGFVETFGMQETLFKVDRNFFDEQFGTIGKVILSLDGQAQEGAIGSGDNSTVVEIS